MLTIGKTRFSPHILERFAVPEIAIRLPGIATPVWLRTEETDQNVFAKVFVANEYAPRSLDPASVATVIDAGANIGASTLWFRLAYPKARIIALEPDPANFACLQRNCASLPGVELLRAALWGEDTELALQSEIEGRPLGSWGTRTTPASGGTPGPAPALTPAWTLDSLSARFGLERLDYVKIDIEGAEKSVFESPARIWLQRTRLIAAEFHDRFLPGCTAAAEAAMGPAVMQKYQRGENVFYRLAA
jgi:FkbM family methyltransferase